VTGDGLGLGSGNSRIDLLKREFKDENFRHSYLARQLKVFLAAQIRALRGDLSQAEFGKLIEKPQSVVSRLERQSYGKVNLQTLIDIAVKLDIGLMVRFVNFPTFVKWTNDYSSEALSPSRYRQEDMDRLLAADQSDSLAKLVELPSQRSGQSLGSARDSLRDDRDRMPGLRAAAMSRLDQPLDKAA
jgi:Helix-turn-helix